MTISELIEHLEALKAEHGDLKVAPWIHPEFVYIPSCAQENDYLGVYA